jgi:hypothetical protein
MVGFMVRFLEKASDRGRSYGKHADTRLLPVNHLPSHIVGFTVPLGSEDRFSNVF